MRQRFPHPIRLTVMGEALPEETNRVELDSEKKDSSGVASPRVTYTYSQNSLKMLEHGALMGCQALEAAGAVDILDSGVIHPAFHLMGTARMGNGPRNSVVNA